MSGQWELSVTLATEKRAPQASQHKSAAPCLRVPALKEVSAAAAAMWKGLASDALSERSELQTAARMINSTPLCTNAHAFNGRGLSSSSAL